MIIIECLFAALLLTVIKKFMPMSSSYSFIRLQVIQLQIQLVILFVFLRPISSVANWELS